MAEDNAINQRVGKLILQKAGFEIDLVGDGSEAVEAHTVEPYDLILMDCQMPIMDGFEASRLIRKLNGQPQPMIIAVTANALVGERERCLIRGHGRLSIKAVSSGPTNCRSAQVGERVATTTESF